MRLVLFDSNVVLDLLLQREGYVNDAAGLFKLAQAGEFNGGVSAASLTDLWYIVQRHRGWSVSRDALSRLVDELVIASVGRREIEVALADVNAGTFRDFEDAVQHAAAEAAGADAIVTRNEADFRDARIVALTPLEFLSRL